MLTSLHIENVAVIEKTDITFGPGLTVLTGETGAGKSIVIDAISAVLGERLSRDIVRTGADRAFVCATFDRVSDAVNETLISLGFEPEEDGVLLLGRSLTSDGRGSCHINGRPATVSALRNVGRLLLNIHGQHENQALLSPESHIGYLDKLGNIDGIHAAYEETYREYCSVRRAIKAAKMDEDEKALQLSKLTRQIDEIDAAALQPGEEEKLKARRETARHAGKLAQYLQSADTLLCGTDNEAGIIANLMDVLSSLSSAGNISSAYGQLAERLHGALYEIEACADEVRETEKSLCFDEQELSAMEDRLEHIRKVVLKYGADEADVLQKREDFIRIRDAIEQNDAVLADLQKQSDIAREKTIAAAERLTEVRKKAAARFETDVCEQLSFLDMPHVRLVVSMEPTALTASGGDKVEFLLSSNPGEPPKSIARTASGGELSRIMLAFKSVLADADEIATVVYDEIDSGISGHAASAVGVLLQQTGRDRQILCVTHLAQIACRGDAHLLVRKQVENDRTYTAVEPLNEAARVRELARIIGGDIADNALETAAEMRRNSREKIY